MNDTLPPTESDAIDTAPAETPGVPVAQQLLLLAVLMLLIFGTGYIPKLVSTSTAPTAAIINTEAVAPTTEVTDLAPATDPFTDVSITGSAAFVWDASTNRSLYQKNPDEQLPLASITKLMTALVAQELLSDATNVPITVAAIAQDGSSGFTDGEAFTLQSLTDITLLSSSNDGAFALAAAAGALLQPDDGATTFIEAMNVRAAELGLSQTYFRNPTGLDISETEAGAYGSARDVAFLMEYILENEPHILEATKDTSATIFNAAGQYYQEHNTNQTVDEVAGMIGSKTGFTELAGGNLTIAFDASLNRPVIVVVLGSTQYGRFADVLTLSETARTALE